MVERGTMMMRDDDSDMCAVPSQSALRGIMGTPMDLALRKQLGKLDRHCRAFIARSPFLCIGTADADGKADVSPRGDPAGFVQVLDGGPRSSAIRRCSSARP